VCIRPYVCRALIMVPPSWLTAGGPQQTRMGAVPYQMQQPPDINPLFVGCLLPPVLLMKVPQDCRFQDSQSPKFETTLEKFGVETGGGRMAAQERKQKLRPAPRFHHARGPVEPLGFSGQQFLRSFLTDQGRLLCSFWAAHRHGPPLPRAGRFYELMPADAMRLSHGGQAQSGHPTSPSKTGWCRVTLSVWSRWRLCSRATDRNPQANVRTVLAPPLFHDWQRHGGILSPASKQARPGTANPVSNSTHTSAAVASGDPWISLHLRHLGCFTLATCSAAPGTSGLGSRTGNGRSSWTRLNSERLGYPQRTLSKPRRTRHKPYCPGLDDVSMARFARTPASGRERPLHHHPKSGLISLPGRPLTESSCIPGVEIQGKDPRHARLRRGSTTCISPCSGGCKPNHPQPSRSAIREIWRARLPSWGRPGW
jgi:hypothetical protein